MNSSSGSCLWRICIKSSFAITVGVDTAGSRGDCEMIPLRLFNGYQLITRQNNKKFSLPKKKKGKMFVFNLQLGTFGRCCRASVSPLFVLAALSATRGLKRSLNLELFVEYASKAVSCHHKRFLNHIFLLLFFLPLSTQN